VGVGLGNDVGVREGEGEGDAVVSEEQAVAAAIMSAPVLSARSKFLVFFMFSIDPVKRAIARQVTNFSEL
jgi:hypothetical protein